MTLINAEELVAKLEAAKEELGDSGDSQTWGHYIGLGHALAIVDDMMEEEA